MATILSIKARQIFDSRGNPTVEVDLACSDGTFARATIPSGASTGIYEALELRDGGSDYLGKGVSKAVDNVNSIIAPALISKDPTQQTAIDNLMVQQLDGTVNEWGWCKEKLGASVILAVSLSLCKAGASVLKIPLYKIIIRELWHLIIFDHIANLAGNKKLVLPVPAFNVINGGSHAGNKLAMQRVQKAINTKACNALLLKHRFFCSQSLTLCESDPKYQHRLKKVQKLEDLLNRGRTITARRFLKSLFLSKTTFSSLCELHAHVSKPLFSDTLLWLCSVSKMLNEATDLYFSMRKDGFLPSTRSVNRLLRTLVASRHFEKTLFVFADVVDSDIQPDVVTYGKAVQAAVMLKDLDKGFDLVSSMEKEGLGPYVFAYNLILGGLCKVRRIKDARKLFDEMIRKNIAPNTVTYNTLIDGYCKVGELEEAFGFKGRMKELNVECNLVTYNCLLSGLCGSGRVEDARKVLLEMEGCGFLPCGFFSVVFDGLSNVADDHGFFDGKEIMIDERTCCILLNGLCRVGRIEKAEEVMAKLVHNGVTPSKISYNILVNAYCEEGDVKKATLAIEQMEERGLQPNRITFNTLISKFCETGEVDQAETWVKRMIEKGVSPTVETYNSLIHGYGQRGHFVRSFEILEEMEKAGIKPNVISYGSLINCLCKDRKLLDAEIVLADMIGRGVSPNAEIYNMLIEASFSLSKLKDAFRFFDEMIQGGIDATLVTYNTLINGLGRNERVKEAEDLVLQMVGKGCNPDVVTYNSLISGYAKSVNTQKCMELYDKMKMVGIKPTIGTFHPLIYACRNVGLAEVERMFKEMLQMDLIPDRFVYNEMIYSYAEDGNVLKAVSLHQQMLDQGVDSDKVTYNCLILAYLRDRRVSEIKHIVDDMKAKGLVPKSDTYNILVKGHCDLKDFNGAYFWYREMTDVGLLLNARMCSLLISGLREEGMLPEAQIVSSELSSRTE